MPRFFFHVRDDLDVPDDEGADFANIVSARDYAASAARVLMCESMRVDRKITLGHRIDIEDSQGQVLSSLQFRDAVRIENLA